MASRGFVACGGSWRFLHGQFRDPDQVLRSRRRSSHERKPWASIDIGSHSKSSLAVDRPGFLQENLFPSAIDALERPLQTEPDEPELHYSEGDVALGRFILAMTYQRRRSRPGR